MMKRLFKPALVLVFAMACSAPALGQQDTWDGGGFDNNWTTDNNWVDDTAPNPAGAGDIIFNGNIRLTPNADVAFVGITSLGFNGTAGAFTISGAQLTTTDPGVGGIPGFGTLIFNNAVGVTQTINNDILAGDFDLALDSFEGDIIFNGNINNNGFDVQLVGFNATNRVNGVISGTGDLIKFETGSAIISGINTFTGDVDIQEGLLQLDGDFDNTIGVNIEAAGIFALGGDETIGSLTGDGQLMLNANELIVGDATSTDFDGVISGTGGLTKQGAGTLTLGGANTFTGPLAINAGTVQIDGDVDDTIATTVAAAANLAIGADQTIGSLAGAGNVQLGANTLTFGDATDTMLDGVISGTGGIVKQGTSMFTLTGVNTFTGDTDINAGHLQLTGSLAGDVNNRSNLSGTGPIAGTLTNFAGSNTFPGTDGTIGTLDVNTDLIHNAGGELELDISRDGGNVITNDVINVGGTATLASGSVINLTDLMGGTAFIAGDIITLITTAGGVTDNGVTINFVSPNIVFTPNINGNNFEAVAIQTGTFRNNVMGANNLALATALDFDEPFAAGDYLAFINAINALAPGDDANAAAQSTIPTPFAAVVDNSIRTIQHHSSMNANYLELKRHGLAGLTQVTDSGAVPGSMQLVSAANDPALLAWALQSQIESELLNQDRLADRAHFYATAFGIFADLDARPDYTGSSSDTFGGQIGFDFQANDEVTLGMMFGYDYTDIDFKGGVGSADIHTIRFGPYLSWVEDNPQKAQLYANGSFSYGYHRIESERTITFAGFTGTPTSDIDGHDVSVYGELGCDIGVGDFTLTPFGSMQFTHYFTGSFTESGGGGAGLTFQDGLTVNSLRTLLGGRVRGVHQLGNLYFATEGFLAWGHEFLNDDDITATFTGGTNQFSIDPSEGATDSAYFGGGLSGLLSESTSAYVRYEGEVSSDSTIHAIGFGITIAF